MCVCQGPAASAGRYLAPSLGGNLPSFLLRRGMPSVPLCGLRKAISILHTPAYQTVGFHLSLQQKQVEVEQMRKQRTVT